MDKIAVIPSNTRQRYILILVLASHGLATDQPKYFELNEP